MSSNPQVQTKPNRRLQILEALAKMLEDSPGERITTANLAKAVQVSEAALYRHFPSKGKMFEGLIEFIEDTLFSRIRVINQEETSADQRTEKMLMLFLTFAERNPGICRILTGDALIGEHERLRKRVSSVYDRFEMELKQVLRAAELNENKRTQMLPEETANLLVAAAEGRVQQYVRSDFERRPTQSWPSQWQTLSACLWRQ